MKLLNYTTSYFSALLLVLISIWAVVFYYAMFDEIYDSIDDGLDNRKMNLIARASKDPDLMQKPQLDEYLYSIEKVDYKDYRGFKDTYKDTVMYMINEEDYEPVRTLESIFRIDQEYYKIKVVTSMVEEDDQVQNLLKYTLILYAALVVSILLLNNFFLRKVWKPFYTLIDQLKIFSLEKNQPIQFTETNIEEFNLLNSSIKKLLQKTKASYTQQKQFIENASHELQTPLAIAINKLEIVFEQGDLTKQQAEQLDQALGNLERLKRLNRSLLLISKIENDQYSQRENLDIHVLLEEVISNYSEMADHKNIDLRLSSAEKVLQSINPDLGYILFSNLIKNAIIHGDSNSAILMELTKNHFIINNYSENQSFENEPIFERFQKFNNSSNSTGLGLAISKTIAEQNGFRLEYSFINNQHRFILNFE